MLYAILSMALFVFGQFFIILILIFLGALVATASEDCSIKILDVEKIIARFFLINFFKKTKNIKIYNFLFCIKNYKMFNCCRSLNYFIKISKFISSNKYNILIELINFERCLKTKIPLNGICFFFDINVFKYTKFKFFYL